MDTYIIKQPSAGVISMLENRSVVRGFMKEHDFDTIGLVQGKLVEMLVAVDVAEKASGVSALEIKGICPQHFAMIALFGDTASVEEAMERIRMQLQKGKG